MSLPHLGAVILPAPSEAEGSEAPRDFSSAPQFGGRRAQSKGSLFALARPPKKVSIRLGRFSLFSMSCGDFYSHLSFD
jgi:hypothetical protein